jgi:hypothetical protein
MKKRSSLKKEDKKNIIILDEGVNSLIPQALCCHVGWFMPYSYYIA